MSTLIPDPGPVTGTTGFQWHVPTIVVGGPDAIDRAAPLIAGRCPSVLVAVDPAPACRRVGDLVVAALGRAGVRTSVRTVPAQATVAAARALAEDLAAAGGGIVAVGGGAVLDVAKVAAGAVRNPDRLAPDTWRGTSAVVHAPAGRPSVPCIAVPTTVGTGSEVSAVAVLDATDPGTATASGIRAAKLLVDPTIRPAVAVLDPRQVAGLPRPARLAGALEIVLRTLGPTLGTPARLPLGDGLATALAGTVVAAGHRVAAAGDDTDETGDTTLLALASAHTHVGWTGTGRDPCAHRLWYLAHAVVQGAPVTKMAATAALLPTYLRWLRAGRLPAHPDLAALLGATGLDGYAVPLLRAWDLPTALDELADVPPPAHLAAAAAAAFGDGPLAGVGPALLERFYDDAATGAAASPRSHPPHNVERR
jgi:alcohol dehydrogenase class IV